MLVFREKVVKRLLFLQWNIERRSAGWMVFVLETRDFRVNVASLTLESIRLSSSNLNYSNSRCRNPITV